MPTKTKKDQIALLEVHTKTAPCVPAIREAVTAWREKDYAGVTTTTRRLLNYWFKTDHRLRNGQMFRYHVAQREAIETLIYLYEVAAVRRRKDLVETYATNTPNLRLLLRQDGDGQRQDEGDGPRHPLALLQRRR
jgi:type III restriction enzyme